MATPRAVLVDAHTKAGEGCGMRQPVAGARRPISLFSPFEKQEVTVEAEAKKELNLSFSKDKV